MKRILVIGGYGAVGRHLVSSLTKNPEMRITIAGRDGDKAHAAASGFGDNVVGEVLDMLDERSVKKALMNADVVVACTEANLLLLAELAVRQGIGFTAIAASAHLQHDLAALDAQARGSGAAGLIGVGLAPGITAQLGRNLIQSGSGWGSLSILVELDALDRHGREAIEWTLDQAALSDKAVPLIVEGRCRSAIPVAFDDLPSLATRLQVPHVDSFLLLRPGFVGRILPIAGRAMGALRSSTPRVHRIATGLLAAGLWKGRLRIGALVRSPQSSKAYWMVAHDQSHITGLVGGEAVRWLCSSQAAPGIHYFDQVVAFSTVKPLLQAAGARFEEPVRDDARTGGPNA
ncbi:MAG TPA: saccharopine dehydrogenase NADP-binding domain-containing protein [Pseudorhizobium sp.]|jgi:hypothetical protein|nr:saccharopine dehydrogenase NADP-binding domain-containing protein [Pseudorhizobium sp.]